MHTKDTSKGSVDLYAARSKPGLDNIYAPPRYDYRNDKWWFIYQEHCKDLLIGSLEQSPLEATIYRQVEISARERAQYILSRTMRIYDNSLIPKKITVLQDLIALAEKKRMMFGIQVKCSSRYSSLIDFLVMKSSYLAVYQLSTDERNRLDLLKKKIFDLVLTGVYIHKECWNLLPKELLKKRSNYLSNLKQIVHDSIEKDGKKDVIKDIVVERDNALYFIQCPEESIVIPAKFISNPEFKNLDGILKIGEGDDVIRIQDGKYHDMKGRLEMTFLVSNSKKIVMTLSSENAGDASSFGKIMVHMDDKSCEIFSKCCQALEKESRTSKVIEAAKSFAQTKSSAVSPPNSFLKNINESQHSQSGVQGVSW